MSGDRGDSGARLRIGAVSRLTGLSVHALRKWEQRYGAVEPVRTDGGERLYTREDVERLSIIRRLAATGLPLGETARWPLPRLRETAAELFGAPGSVPGAEAGRPVRVAICGTSLPARLAAGLAASPSLEFVAGASSVDAMVEAIAGEPVDLLVCELPTVHPSAVRAMRRAVSSCRARRGVVVCEFGSSAGFDALRHAGFDVLREPLDIEALARAAGPAPARADAPAPLPEPGKTVDDDPVPPPRFSRDTVARVAASAPSVRCECPRHLAQILFSLRAFEQYSVECEDASPTDAALHRYLGATAGRARAAFEEALARVAEAEGIGLQP